jgi:carbohydrate kinase (thermoresistant glucokinase family)
LIGEVHAIVVMGVSGCGKSTVAARLAQRLGWDLAEADTFHSAANVEKMRSGIALTDADRGPWLDAIAAWIDSERIGKRPCVVACSALKRRYRERLSGGNSDVRFVFLSGPYDLVATRLAGRSGHYMPLSLLQSQFDALEPPGPEENPIVLSIALPVDEIVDEVMLELGRAPSPS